MVMAVGAVMGIHALYEIIVGGTEMSLSIMLTYLPVSVLWGRIFLKEKLSKKHYAAICLTGLGIIIMGVFDV